MLTPSQTTMIAKSNSSLSHSLSELYQGDQNMQNFDSRALRRRTRQWTQEEDDRLRAATALLGTTKWQIIAQYVGNGRNQSQCSQRWQRVLDPRLKKTQWTEEEDNKLEELIKKFGTQRWMKIASIFGDRSDVQCRYRYQQLKKIKGNIKTNYSEGDLNMLNSTKLQLPSISVFLNQVGVSDIEFGMNFNIDDLKVA